MRRGNEAVAPLQQAPDSESEEDLEWKVLSIVGTRGKEPRVIHPIIVTPNHSDPFIVTFIQSNIVTSIRVNQYK